MNVKVQNATGTNQSIPASSFFIKKIAAHQGSEDFNERTVKGFVNLIMAGTYAHTNISYPAVVRAHGPLLSPQDARAATSHDGSVLFTWTDNSGIGNANGNDKLLLTAYFPLLKQMVHMVHPATRSKGSARVLMNSMRGFVADTWVCFISHDEREVGNSVSAGRLTL